MFSHLYVILFTEGAVGFPACITGHMTRWSASRGGLHLGGLPLEGVCIHGGLGRPPGWDIMGYCQQVGGMHPIGMHSCFIL